MAWLNGFLDFLFPDAVIYGITLIVFLVGVIKCCVPVLRGASALRRAEDMLKEGAKAKMGKAIWHDAGFLGKRLQPVWRAYLQSVDVAAAGGLSSDVAEYVHEDSIITDPGKAALADSIPGLCTSMGILGTFIGLSMGLAGLDVMEMSSYAQLTGGIALAFNTSIVGIIASVVFSVIYRHAVGRAHRAIDGFVATFYRLGAPQPADATTQLLAFEREQSGAMHSIAGEMSHQIASEMYNAMMAALTPMQQSMQDFMNVATRAQVEGLDYVVSRFVEQMDRTLDGQLHRLSQSLKDAADGQAEANGQLRELVEAMRRTAQLAVDAGKASEEVISRFSGYVGDMGAAYKDISNTQADVGDLLEDISDASERQSQYLSAIEDYQAKLQGSFHDYTLWTDQFISGLEQRTAAQNAMLEQVAMEMRAGAEVLRDAYRGLMEAAGKAVAAKTPRR